MRFSDDRQGLLEMLICGIIAKQAENLLDKNGV